MHPYRNRNEEESKSYMEDIYKAQEDLGYFPEFDKRAEQRYNELLKAYDAHYANQMENGSDDIKAYITNSRAQLDTYYRESTGYFPNRPELHAVEQCNGYSETEDVSQEKGTDYEVKRENLISNNSDNSQNVYENNASFDMSSYVSDSFGSSSQEAKSESEDNSFDINSYAGVSSNSCSQESSESESEERNESLSYP